MTESLGAKLRIDKWLWYARFFKTRTLAAEVANGGKIRVNKVAVRKASADVRVGDVLTVHQGPNIRVVEILALGASRRPFEEARLLYHDLAPMPERKPKSERTDAELAASQAVDARTIPVAEREYGAGRPTKRERRDTDRLRDL
ncbi:MAG: RNA-binding S4 domain-containing protein [Alphaproteobacteria bacterium TMED89]|nr:RNA-binding protein S4 [Rhodospirillaceae bacterium]RPH12818.1 MAG: RNA-binding S4 domain-containing protein [Alphaproteobacteria bacterium TMED89]